MRSTELIVIFIFQEFGDSARARKLYEQDSDDDDDEELEINIKLEQGTYLDNVLDSFRVYYHTFLSILL